MIGIDTIILGSNGVVVYVTIKDEDGTPVNLEGSTVTASINVMGDKTSSIDKEIAITDYKNGKCTFEIRKEDIPQQGFYSYRVVVESPGKTFPSIKRNFQVMG